MLASIQKIVKDQFVLSLAILFTIVVYSRFLFFHHISWDDPEMVFANEDVQSFDVAKFFSKHYVGNYIPVTMLFHALSWLVFGNYDGGHHLILILLHIFNGLLVFNLGRSLFRNEFISLAGTLVFLLHPIQIESVGWISELKNVLSTSFYLGSCLIYLRYKNNASLKNYLLCFFLFVLGCLSKSSVVILPLVFICFDFYSDKKIELKSILHKVPFFVVSVIIGIINIKTQTSDQFINHAHEFPMYQRIGLAGFALLSYLRLVGFPIHLSVIYPYPELKQEVFVIGYFVLILILFLTSIFIYKKRILVPFILAFVLINLILVLQFLPFGEVLFADRYMYVPMIGLGWAIGAMLSKIKLNHRLIFISILILLSVLSYARIQVWKTSLSLYGDILEKYPNEFIALNSAGVESMFLNEDKNALNYFNKATAAAPRNYKGFYNKGLLYLKNNQADLAIRSFNESLDLYDYSKAYTGRAAAYYMKGDIPKAMQDAKRALELDQENAKAHFVLGNCFNELNQLNEALNEYNTCIRLNGKDADFYFKRAIVYGKKQDFKSSLNDLTVCTDLHPDYYEAYYWKGVIKINLKQNPCEDLKIAAGHNYEPAIKAYYKYCK